MKTELMKKLFVFLQGKNRYSSEQEFLQDLEQMWFGLYSRGDGERDSSGFEHVFSGTAPAGTGAGPGQRQAGDSSRLLLCCSCFRGGEKGESVGISQLDPLLPPGKAGGRQLLQPQLQRAVGLVPRRAGAPVQLGWLLQGGGLGFHRLQPRVRVRPLLPLLPRAARPGMPPEPGRAPPQHPDLPLDQVHLRQRQEVHRHRLRDVSLRGARRWGSSGAAPALLGAQGPGGAREEQRGPNPAGRGAGDTPRPRRVWRARAGQKSSGKGRIGHGQEDAERNKRCPGWRGAGLWVQQPPLYPPRTPFLPPFVPPPPL
uniref:Uridylate-specific endoribonuclease n=1 Tax=Taeniopygia guttata TaxID=59729 RepID=A0A674GG66_TAEGU